MHGAPRSQVPEGFTISGETKSKSAAATPSATSGNGVTNGGVAETGAAAGEFTIV